VGMELGGLISDRSLDNLAKVGVMPKTIYPIGWKLYRFVSEKKIPILRSRNIDLTHWADTHIFWKQFIAGLEHGQQEQGVTPLIPIDFTYIKIFLEQRNEQYLPQLERLKTYDKEEYELDGEFMVSFYKPVIPHTCLLEEEKQTLVEALKCYPKLNDLDSDVSEIIFLFLNDFYLSIFAVIDFTYGEFLKSYANSTGNEFSWPKNGIIAEVMQLEGTCYFGRFINFIKKRLCTNYSTLAAAIPVNFNEKTDSGRTFQEAQKDTLKDWRKGKTQPTFRTMNTFFENLKFLLSTDYSFYGLMFQSIDRYVRYHDSKPDEPEKKQLLEKVFSEQYYKRHYQKVSKLPIKAA